MVDREGPDGAGPRPRDDNLRLVLSPEQEHWILQQIAAARGMALASLVFLVLGLGWLTADFGGFLPRETHAGCFELPPDAPDFQELEKRFRAQGLVPCPSEAAGDDGFQWRDLRMPLALLAVLMLVVSPLTLVRNLVLWRRYSRYRTDHEAFLRRYNRL